MTNPLFMSGTARGGTNLTTMMLSVHPEVSLSQDPFLPLFKSLRNAIVARSGKAGFDPESPLDEYYYFDEKLDIMKQIQAGDLDLAFDVSERPRLMETLAKRMKLSSPLLILHLEELKGKTYKELFESALRIVALGRKSPKARWIGFNDNWTVEFFPLLARAFPQSRFVVILRDVRASIASNRLVEEPKLIPLALSFARHWRKQLAFARRFRTMELFKNRLHIVSYERLVKDPEKNTRELCTFLGIDFDPGMLDTNRFVGPGGQSWIPNSNIDTNAPKTGIYQSSVDQWIKKLPVDVTRLIEWTVAPDLDFAGYRLSQDPGDPEYYASVYARMHRDHGECQGWRTDSKNPTVDFALELLRDHCLKHPTKEERLVERCFLFPEIYKSFLDGELLFNTPKLGGAG